VATRSFMLRKSQPLVAAKSYNQLQFTSKKKNRMPLRLKDIEQYEAPQLSVELAKRSKDL
jgi:hypothetical protein